MRTEATAHTVNDRHEDVTAEARPVSGRRIKAAAHRPAEELGLSMTDALEHILRDEHRSA
jgi:hypothetical protein